MRGVISGQMVPAGEVACSLCGNGHPFFFYKCPFFLPPFPKAWLTTFPQVDSFGLLRPELPVDVETRKCVNIA
jgi:hypothetical protein